MATAYGGLTGMSTIYLKYRDVTNTLSLCHRYLQWQVLGEGHAIISRNISNTLEVVSVY